MSLRLNTAMIARIEADRIYALILPEMEGRETVTVPLPFLENVLTTGKKLEGLAPTYVKRALDDLTGTTRIRRFRRKAVVPRQRLASVAAAFRIAADAADGRLP